MLLFLYMKYEYIFLMVYIFPNSIWFVNPVLHVTLCPIQSRTYLSIHMHPQGTRDPARPWPGQTVLHRQKTY